MSGGDLVGSFRDRRRPGRGLFGRCVGPRRRLGDDDGAAGGVSVRRRRPNRTSRFQTGPDGRRDAWPPDAVAARFNRLMLEEMQVEQYFTMAYAEVDLRHRQAGAGAGRPSASHACCARDGRVRAAGPRRAADRPDPRRRLMNAVESAHRPGDRLFLMSDGFTECPRPDGRGSRRRRADRQPGTQSAQLCRPALLEALVWDLASHAGTDVVSRRCLGRAARLSRLTAAARASIARSPGLPSRSQRLVDRQPDRACAPPRSAGQAAGPGGPDRRCTAFPPTGHIPACR